MNFKVGDKVVVIAGKDKGKEGKIIKTLKNDNKVVVEGINMVTKHVDPTCEERETTLILGVYSGLGFSPTQNTHPKTEEPPAQRTATR